MGDTPDNAKPASSFLDKVKQAWIPILIVFSSTIVTSFTDVGKKKIDQFIKWILFSKIEVSGNITFEGKGIKGVSILSRNYDLFDENGKSTKLITDSSGSYKVIFKEDKGNLDGKVIKLTYKFGKFNKDSSLALSSQKKDYEVDLEIPTPPPASKNAVSQPDMMTANHEMLVQSPQPLKHQKKVVKIMDAPKEISISAPTPIENYAGYTIHYYFANGSLDKYKKAIEELITKKADIDVTNDDDDAKTKANLIEYGVNDEAAATFISKKFNFAKRQKNGLVPKNINIYIKD